MKTSTLIIVAGAGILTVYLLTRPRTPSLSAPKTTSTSAFGALGQVLGGVLLGSGGSLSRPSSGGVTSGSSGGSSFGTGSNGDSEVAIVRSLDAGNIGAYDAQGTPDAPVYGIAGLDY